MDTDPPAGPDLWLVQLVVIWSPGSGTPQRMLSANQNSDQSNIMPQFVRLYLTLK